ncbi:DsbA family protein [Oricola cellulosilytica]|uniref:DsbA family protein n=1 Tax=Oricola cellulosilytica TaxID=1429082 RepID=A0A4R0P352_9HYPH|nr:DsbA family protein [Oricola cellulosilytica]TCD11285.1 DsbA family protein [Oricola cellulosilytica]
MTKTLFTRRSALLSGAAVLATVAVPQLLWAQSAPSPEGEVDVDKLMETGPLEEIVVGSEDAPITVVEYASMTCGFCARFHTQTWPAIKEKYIDTGKARFILREFPFDPRAAAAFMLARCAPAGKYVPMIDVLYKQQDEWARAQNARAPLMNIAKLAGFTQESFEACLTDQKLLDDINTVRERGSAEFGVNATPTFFINGKKYSGALTVEQMSAIFDDLL